MSKAGLTVRTYSESMNPGQDPRSDSVAEPRRRHLQRHRHRRHQRHDRRQPAVLRGRQRPVQGQARPVDRLPDGAQPAGVLRRQPHDLRHAVHRCRLDVDVALLDGQRRHVRHDELDLRPVRRRPRRRRRRQHQLHRARPVRRHARRRQRHRAATAANNNNGQNPEHQARRHLPEQGGHRDPGLGRCGRTRTSASPSSSCSTKAKAPARLVLRLERGRQELRRARRWRCRRAAWRRRRRSRRATPTATSATATRSSP